MRQINNSDAAKAIQGGAKLQVNGGYPNLLGDTCVPTMDMTPDFHRVINLVKFSQSDATGTVTVHTTHATKKTYLYGSSLSLVASSTNNNSTGFFIKGYINGEQVTLNNLPYFISASNLLSTSVGKNLFPAIPILLDKNTLITLEGNWAAGTGSKTAILFLTEIEE
jgi:hypothetical protein